ncbi:MAG: [protein-PII] uridylyltransferase [Xanthomonadales bacterium]|nr:[protein-PII] uridylyltransferase [Xanthomonadales bacterium]
MSSETVPGEPDAALEKALETLLAEVSRLGPRIGDIGSEAAREAIARCDVQAQKQFSDGVPVERLIRFRARVIECLLTQVWRQLIPNPESFALVAVGGFGRGELHPHSDVDLSVIVKDAALDSGDRDAIERFFTLFWDAGLVLGHSVRTVEQCVEQASDDVVTATNLMESRLLHGNRGLFEQMQTATGPERMWPADRFFQAKYAEQRARHQRFGDTAYNLEPNIKEGPGGLRDIQMIAWVCRRRFGATSLAALFDRGFLDRDEWHDLEAGQQFLWAVRFALHSLCDRAEDRLLFEHQRAVATMLGFGESGPGNAAVEAFMQRYYRVVTRLERLNDTLLQLFRERLIDPTDEEGELLGGHFVLVNGYLGLRNPQRFTEKPAALVEVFTLLARRPDVRGLRATAIRQIRQGLAAQRRPLYEDAEALEAFHDLLRQPEGVYTQLQRMNRYGVLAALVPPFGRITGRMQFDLFHAYTVDQHTLFVVRNLRRFAYGKYAGRFPGMAALFDEIERPDLLYLAALFHDIAKGRGGDHSELGAEDALEYGSMLGLPDEESELVSWLVRHHLVMSQTAQRKDITDPAVIEQFARLVGHPWRLRYLYLLTVADISATSPRLWNAWKAGLLRELYEAAQQALSTEARSDRDPVSRQERAREDVRALLAAEGAAAERIEQAWAGLPGDSFLRLSVDQMAWACRQSLDLAADDPARVAVRNREDLGISEILVNAPDYTGLFASVTALMDEAGLNVLAARVFTTDNGRSFDLFQVMTLHGHPMVETDSALLAARVADVLNRREVVRPAERPMPRRLRPFIGPPEIGWDTARNGQVTVLELTCTDQPGLLSRLAAAMVACEIRIHDAMIATLGDRVEDTFYLTDRNNALLEEEHQAQLERAILPIWRVNEHDDQP